MKRKSASDKSQAAKNLPKRKIGRYIVVFVLAIPAFMQLKYINLSMPDIKLPSFELQGEVEFTNVIIDGELVFSDKESLQKMLSERLTKDFVRLDLDEIQAGILENSWYRKVELSRVWPSSLKVKIEEQQPIARWGDAGFINRYGEIVLNGDVAMINHLPLLEGREERAYEIAKSYLTMSQMMIDQQLYISKLSVSPSGDWSMRINDEFELVLGNKQVSKRIERFLYLYEKQLAPLKEDVASIDMRYQSGVAVKWKKQALVANATSKKFASR